MNNGISILEILIAMVISLTVLSIIITHVSHSTSIAKTITTNQEVIESIFHTVDTIKTDLSKCGMRLQEVGNSFGLVLFSHSNYGFKILYGVSGEASQ